MKEKLMTRLTLVTLLTRLSTRSIWSILSAFREKIMNEAETRAELIDPALAAAGWGVIEGSKILREYPHHPRPHRRPRTPRRPHFRAPARATYSDSPKGKVSDRWPFRHRPTGEAVTRQPFAPADSWALSS